MSLINISNLTFAYDGSYDNIFENVSFQLDTDWKLGFTGRNGRGKTTFLQLLLGKYEYSGTITASIPFDYFPFPVPDKSLFTMDIIDSITPNIPYWRLVKEFSRLELPEELLYRPFSTLSNGEQSKVLLASLFLKEEHFLLIDEPTNHLDRQARQLVSHYLQRKKGFILVSHDRSFLDNCIDHVLSINRANIEVQKGNFTSWLRNKEMRDQYELSENQRLKKDISRLKDASTQANRWADKVESTKIGRTPDMNKADMANRDYIGEKSRRMQQRRKNLERRQEKALEEKSRLLKNIETVRPLKLSPLAYHSQRLIHISNLTISYEEFPICQNFNLTIQRGERISLQGKNGCGKSSILKLIVGENIPYWGNFQKASKLKISYVPQSAAFLQGDLSSYARQEGIDESLLKAILRKLDFSRTQFEKPMELFSEGQKKKVLLAGSLCNQAHLYIWDEPLNYIDVFSRIQIEHLLLEYQPTLLFVEHDQAFTEKIATEIIEM